jgi:hypothetical protein
MKKPDQKPETPDQAKKRLQIALAAEVQAYQQQGMPNEVIGLRVYAALVEARYEVEQLRATASRLAEQLGQEISAIAKTS